MRPLPNLILEEACLITSQMLKRYALFVKQMIVAFSTAKVDFLYDYEYVTDGWCNDVPNDKVIVR